MKKYFYTTFDTEVRPLAGIFNDGEVGKAAAEKLAASFKDGSVAVRVEIIVCEE